VFTLEYAERYGVTVKPMWPEVPVSEAAKKFSVGQVVWRSSKADVGINVIQVDPYPGLIYWAA
jgi:hypothetical protein